MNPIRFSCEATLAVPPEPIAQRILDLSRWSDFQGYGGLPGIRSAEFERRTPEIVGSRIRMTNTDGSTHAEEIVEWEPRRRLRLRMSDFSPPLSKLATSFDETWEFTATASETQVVRSFVLHPRFGWTRPLLGLISILLKLAIARHLRAIQAATRGEA